MTLQEWQLVMFLMAIWISSCAGACMFLLWRILALQGSQNDELTRLTRPKGMPGTPTVPFKKK
jgi:hypothetical protein